ncbi:tyrosine-protein phosphatase [Priestia flexa]|uniref:tyrosine-protein phosphatase n=1 Tax=Priestia flexa TaxID=86664 RepID=UPI000954042C|nr:tyrosine-protein phosphatase [Priestia flexa]SIQ65821.1 Tyrosine phosphatase family protein [Priestia flexa]
MNYNFKKLFNFRDVGGVVTENGEKLKEGILFGSEDLSKLTKQDIETFRQLNIKAICDLRMPSEQKSRVSRVQPGPDIELLSVSIHDKSQELTHFEFLKFLVSKLGPC